MINRKLLLLGTGCLVFCFTMAFPSLGQFREYYIYGKVVDTDHQPLLKVEILLRDKNTSRGYKVQTNKKGEYKLAGLPHGIYEVTAKKEGYKTETAEWNFETPQDRMQKVEMETIVLVSEEKIKEIEQAEKAKAEFNAALEKMRQGDYDGAILSFKKMIADNPENANAYYLLGLNYLKKEMLPEAIEALSKTIELSPSFSGAYHQLGICYRQQNELDKALNAYEKALELAPESVDTLYNRGLILFELNRVEEALTHFENALELKPDDPELIEMIGRCYIHQGQYSKALEYLERAKNASTDQEKVKFLEQLITKLKEQIKKNIEHEPRLDAAKISHLGIEY